MFYSSPNNLIAPGQATVMGEGWETARRRDDGNDWVSVRLAAPGVVQLVELDTSHFKGNAPGWAAVSACDERKDPDDVVRPAAAHPAAARHPAPVPSWTRPEVTHVRLDIYPDGGMARLRLIGTLTSDGAAHLRANWAKTTN